MSVYYAEDRLTLLHGDAANLDLDDHSVDLIVTSPPYFGLRSYKDGGEHYQGQIGDEATPAEFVAALIRCTREWVRVLKPSGSLWVNLGDKYAAHNGPQGATGARNDRKQASTYTRTPRAAGAPPKSLIGVPWRYALACIDDLGLILRAEVIWSKPNGLPESVTDRVRRSHETWFHFVKQPRYFSAVDEIRDAYLAPNAKRTFGKVDPSRGDHGQPTARKDAKDTANPLGKLPGSVWTIPTQPLTVPDHLGIDHFAAFPMEWPRRIIRGWAPAAGVVLDPFGGTGTTALVAYMLGRHGISNDLSADYCRLAKWRTTDPKQRATAAQVDPAKAPQHVDGQGVLL